MSAAALLRMLAPAAPAENPIRRYLQALEAEALARIRSASDLAEVEKARLHYLGRKGALTACLRDMGRLSADERPASRPSTLTSSSKSGQWMPVPAPMSRQFSRSLAVPC